jgi:hypothetical protein
MKLEVHVHNHIDAGSLALLENIYREVRQTKGVVMALSQKMQEFVDATSTALSAASTSLANITADIQKLLAGGTLSPEDAAALDTVTANLNKLAADLQTASEVVPE